MGGVLLLLGAFMLLGRGGSTPAAAPATIKPLHPVTKGTAKQAAKAVKKTTVTRTRARRTAGEAKAPLAPPKVAKTDAATDGMPSALSAALANHSVVIVSLVVPDAPVDELAYAEARAGAAKAGAGFVRIDASNNDDVQALSTLVNTSADAGNRLLDSPATLVFQQPHTLYVRINGYVDADTIAQAAANAAPAPATAAATGDGSSAWITQVNAACTKLRSDLAGESFPTKESAVIPFLHKLVGAVKATVDKIRGVEPPQGKRARVAAMLAAYDRMFKGIYQELDAAQRHQLFKLTPLQAQVERDGKLGDEIAGELGANACVG